MAASSESIRADAPVSATGGSARTQAGALDERRWTSRPALATLVASGAVLIPLAVSALAVHLGAQIVPRPRATIPLVVWFVALAVLATLVLRLVETQARRLLPLAMMLRLAIVFPDRSPSRFSIALRTGTGKELERSLAESTTEAQFATPQRSAEAILQLVGMLARHDRRTRGHSERVRAYADLIGEQLDLDAESRGRLHWASLLHDVGKLDVPPGILNKKDRLTDEEWQQIRRHPEASERRLAGLADWLGPWARAATEHHERFDGGGYPRGLRGAEISLAGRIVAVADAFDVMTAARSYKRPLPAAQARAELAANSGTQFDPQVVRAFLCVSLSRLRLVMGPLAWLARLPGLLQAATHGAASLAGAATVAATVVAGPQVVPATEAPHAPVSLASLDDSASRSVTDRADEARHDPSSTGGAGDEVSSGVGPSVRPSAATTTRAPVTSTPSYAASPGSAATKPTSATTSTTSSTTTTTPPNQPPIVSPDVAPLVLLGSEVTVEVLANDSDPDGALNPATLAVVGYPPVNEYQSITVVGQTIVFRPKPLFVGTSSFTYRVCDNAGACGTALVTVRFVLSL